MKYISVFLLILSSAIISLAQTQVTITETWIETIPADSSVGIYENSYIFNGAPDGYFKIYEDLSYGKIIMEGAFQNEKMQGKWLFYTNNILSEEVNYIDGIRNGFYRSYYPSGKLRIYAFYKNGKAEGDYFLYNEDGSLRAHYKMYNGEIIE